MGLKTQEIEDHETPGGFSWQKMFDDILSPGDYKAEMSGYRDMSQAAAQPAQGAQGGRGPQPAPQIPGYGQQMQGGGLMGMPPPVGPPAMMQENQAPGGMGTLQGLMGMGAKQNAPQQRQDPFAMMDPYLRGLMNV